MGPSYDHLQVAGQTFFQDETVVVTVLDHLFSVPLYGWYVYILDLFEEGQIQGTLLDTPIEIWGPFQTEKEALDEATSYMESPPMNSHQG